MEYLNLTTGVSVAIYADEGYNYLGLQHRSATHDQQHGYTENKAPNSKSNKSTSQSDETSSSDTNIRAWLQSRHNSSAILEDDATGIELPPGTSAMRQFEPINDLHTFLRFAIKCCDSIEYMHQHGIQYHGEIRLQTFQWNGSDDGYVKLWNFGSASRSFDLSTEGWRKTRANKEFTQMLLSALVYISPEQTGRTTYSPDHRSDVYSFGIAFFVLLTGRAPFDGGALEILNGVLSKKVPLVHEVQKDVPEILSKIVEKMTNKVNFDAHQNKL